MSQPGRIVPVEESNRFLVRWKDNARIMAQQSGLIRARLFRSVVDDPELHITARPVEVHPGDLL